MLFAYFLWRSEFTPYSSIHVYLPVLFSTTN
jgi:hypothetical protein